MAAYLITFALLASALPHRSRDTGTQTSSLPLTWAEKYGPQFDLAYSGPLSFAHLPYSKCLDAINDSQLFDIAILGVPFDSAVSYRPGARFGPYGIRSGSRRISPNIGYTTAWGE
jgi:agmatinase